MGCEFDGCSEPSTTFARGRARRDFDHPGHPRVGKYCDAHAEIVADEGHPEYVVYCPNCGCHFGVN